MAIDPSVLAGIEQQSADRLKAYDEKYGHVSEETGQSMVMHSIAISLKRIADVQERMLAAYAPLVGGEE